MPYTGEADLHTSPASEPDDPSCSMWYTMHKGADWCADDTAAWGQTDDTETRAHGEHHLTHEFSHSCEHLRTAEVLWDLKTGL